MENLDQQEVESHMQLRNHIRHWQNFEAIDFIFSFLSEDYPGSITFIEYQLSQVP